MKSIFGPAGIRHAAGTRAAGTPFLDLALVVCHVQIHPHMRITKIESGDGALHGGQIFHVIAAPGMMGEDRSSRDQEAKGEYDERQEPGSHVRHLTVCDHIFDALGLGPVSRPLARGMSEPRYSGPDRLDAGAYQHCWVSPLSRNELLRAPIVDFSDIEVAFLVHMHSVNAPKAARKIAPGSPGVEEAPFQVILDHFGRAAVVSPEMPVGRHDDDVHVRRRIADAPLVEEFAVLIEDLDAMIVPVIDKHTAGLDIDCDAMHAVEVAGARFIWGGALLAPGHDV